MLSLRAKQLLGEVRLLLLLFIRFLIIVVIAVLVGGSVERAGIGLLLGAVILMRMVTLWLEWRTLVRGLGWAATEGGAPHETGGAAGPRAHRSFGDVVSEAVSLVTVLPLSFLLALMLTAPVVVWSGQDRGPVLIAVGIGVGLHFAANLIPASSPAWRIRARAILLAVLLVPSFLVAKAQHPYLLAGGEKHRLLLAERIWNLGLSVEAGRHAGHLVDYAKDLERAQRWEDAALVYHRALELDAFHPEAQERMAQLRLRLSDGTRAAESGGPAMAALDPQSPRPRPAAARAAGKALPAYDWTPTHRLKICLVPAGEVSAGLLDRAGAVLARELQVEVYRWDAPPLALPAPGRKSAMFGHPQWEANEVMRRFIDRLNAEAAQGRVATGTWQFLLVTEEDLYLPGANFVFAANFPIHGLVSTSRMRTSDAAKLEARLSKQLVATAIRCFGLRPSSDASCVSAYVRSVSDLDRRSASPAPPTRAEYLRRVALWESDPRRLPDPPEP